MDLFLFYMLYVYSRNYKKKTYCKIIVLFSALVPEFKIKLNDVTVPERKDATFKCKLNDDEVPLDWYFKGNKVRYANLNLLPKNKNK